MNVDINKYLDPDLKKSEETVDQRLSNLPDIRKPGRCQSVTKNVDPELLQAALSAINAGLNEALSNKGDLEKAARDAIALCYGLGALPKPHPWFKSD